MKSKPKPMCCNCKFLGSPFRGESYQFRDDMDCARHAPIVKLTEYGRKSVFPPVKGNDWCGDFIKGELLE